MRLRYDGTFNVSLLFEKLEQRFPELIHPAPLPQWPENRCYDFTLESIGVKPATAVFITMPDDVPQARVDAIILAHDPRGKSKGEIAEEKRQADRGTGLAKLRAAGLTDDELKALFE